MTKKSGGTRIKIYAYFIFVFILILFILFNDYGLVKFLKLKAEVEEINTKIKKAEATIDSLDREIELLKNDLDKIEEVAREKYNMRKKNERSLKIEVR